MSVGAIDVNFAHHGKAQTVVHLTKFLNLCIAARLLLAKLITGHGNNHKTAFAVFFMQCLQSLVLGRKATFTGGVNNQQYFAAVVF